MKKTRESLSRRKRMVVEKKKVRIRAGLGCY